MPDNRGGRPPLSHAQRGLWLLDRLHPGDVSYNVPFTARLRGPLDVAALRRAFDRLVARHEALRTTFPASGGEPYRQVGPAAAVAVPVVAAASEEEALRIAQECADRPFDLADGPLLRALLIRVAAEDHLLVVVLHHIVCDGQSMRLLFDELAAGYADAPQEPLPSPPLERSTDPDELDWWRAYLEGAPTVLDLPADRPRPAVRGTAGATHTFPLPEAAVAEAGALAARVRATPFMVFLAAYAALLGRLTGARDLLVGTPFSGRDEPELDELIGFFVTTLPVRVDLSGDPTFAELVRRVRDSVLEVLTHRDVPFEKLVEALRLERDPARTPLVQAMLTFEPGRLAEPRFPGLTCEIGMLFTPTAKFDLDLMIVKGAGGDHDVHVTYDAALFTAASARLLGERFARLLAAGVADPGTPVRLLPLLDEAERRAVTRDWSAPEPTRDTGTPVHELIARQAAATPDAPAVETADGVTTYAGLVRRAARLAGRLRADGVAPDEVVGILLPRGADHLTAMLGVLWAGAAYLPLDPAHPPARRAALTAAAGVRHVVTGVDADAEPAPPAPVHPASLAYAIFTSGSTGEPKGVGVPHAALVNHAQAVRDAYGLVPGDRVLQFAAPVFDVAAEEVFPTWLAGGCVVLCPDPVPAPAKAGEMLAGVTVANLPSGYWQQWAATGEPPPPGLRLVVIGSEHVDPAAVARRPGAVPMINAYGLTETTITAVLHHVSGPSVPIGRPIDGVRAYVLDADLEPVPPGVPGELYLAGTALARGYLGRPDLTADRFPPDPYGPPGSRMHRTGDRAVWRADGTLDLHGRLDEQLKVHGHRIEPAEVEAALHACPGVARAAVAVRDGRLVGYVVPAPGAGPLDGLRGHLAARLPAYLVPTRFMTLPALPMTPGGKLDRAALPAPEITTTAAPARTGLERRLAAIWAEALGLDRVGVDDNFFDLGGTSFTLAAVHAGITETLGRDLPLVTLYEHPTIAALAASLDTPPPAGDDRPGARLRAGRDRLQRRRAAR